MQQTVKQSELNSIPYESFAKFNKEYTKMGKNKIRKANREINNTK